MNIGDKFTLKDTPSSGFPWVITLIYGENIELSQEIRLPGQGLKINTANGNVNEVIDFFVPIKT
jgi:hypothetical protein